MYALVETSAIYSEQINAVVAEQAPGEQLARRLDRLLACVTRRYLLRHNSHAVQGVCKN